MERIFLKSWRPYLWIVLAGFLLYFKTLFYDLTYLDDNVWVLDYQWFLKNFSNSLQVFRRPDIVSGLFYRPLLNLSFIISAQMSGSSPFAYHLTNILIHLLAASLFFSLLNKLNYSRELSFLSSLIFTVHPVLTQAVVWIPGRTDSLLGVFVLTSFIFFLNFLKTKIGKYYMGHLFFLFFALLTKETAIALPLICFLYLQLIFKRKASSLSQKIFMIPWFIILSVWLMIRQTVLTQGHDTNVFLAVQSVFLNLPAIISYIGKIILPFNLSVLPILRDITPAYGLVAMVLLVVLLVLSRNKRLPYVLFGISWFFLFLLPSLVFSFLKHEYRVYLPMMGCMMVLLETDGIKHLVAQRKKMFTFGVIVLGFFSVMTFRYSDRFQNRLTFWESAIKTSPHSPLAHRNRGAMYHLEKQLDQAEAEYKKSLELNFHEPMVHNNLGLIYMDRDMYKEAEEEYKLEIAINPLYDNVYYNFGLLCYREGRFDKAVDLWKKTLVLNPEYIDAYKNLAVYYINQKDFTEASYYVEGLRKRGITIPVISDALKNHSMIRFVH